MFIFIFILVRSPQALTVALADPARSAFADYLAGEQKILKDFEGLSLIRDKFLRQFYA